MDTKGPINHASEGNHYIYVNVDHFSKYIVIVPTPKKNDYYVLMAMIHHWISKIGLLLFLIKDWDTENPNSKMAKCSTLFNIRHSRRTSHAPWTNRPVEEQNKILGSHLRLFLQDNPKKWSSQVLLLAYAHNTQLLSYLNIPPYEISFHTQPRILLNFQLKFPQNSFRECTVQNCSGLVPHSQYHSIDSNLLFHGIVLKPIFT